MPAHPHAVRGHHGVLGARCHHGSSVLADGGCFGSSRCAARSSRWALSCGTSTAKCARWRCATTTPAAPRPPALCSSTSLTRSLDQPSSTTSSPTSTKTIVATSGASRIGSASARAHHSFLPPLALVLTGSWQVCSPRAWADCRSARRCSRPTTLQARPYFTIPVACMERARLVRCCGLRLTSSQHRQLLLYRLVRADSGRLQHPVEPV